MKNLMKILLVFIAISVLWNINFMGDTHITYSGDLQGMDWLITNALVVGVVFFAIALVLVLFISVFSAVIFFAGLVCATMLFVGVSFFWPIILVAMVMYWMFSDSKATA